jgi:prickle
MKLLPEPKIPKLGTPGTDHREAQLAQQLPKQDLSLKQCQHISSRDQTSYQDFICARNDIALDIGHAIVIPRDVDNNHAKHVNDSNLGGGGCVVGNCRKCKGALTGGDLAVVAPRFGLRDFWHPGCFTCTTCDEILVDLTYCVHNDNLFCERHYAENLKPRCGACDELIFAGQYTKVLNYT